MQPESYTLNTRGIVSSQDRDPGDTSPASAPQMHGENGDMPTLPESEAALIKSAIAQAKGNLSKAARLLKISRPTLAYRAQKHGLE